MKILVIHQYYLAPGQPGGSRFNELARRWTEAGHHVTVIAGTVSYATGQSIEDAHGWVMRRTEEGIDVWRCHVPATYNRSYIGRMWAFFGFTLTSTIATLRVPRPDVVISSSPPLTTAVTGWIAALRHRAKWVFEVRDLWPESAVTTGVLREKSLLTRILYALERFACRRAAAINVLTPAFAADLERRGLAGPDKISFVPNGADLDIFRPQSRDNDVRCESGWGDRFVALYAGAHGRANALTQLVDAAELLRDRSDILIVSVGDGPERQTCERMASDRGLSNIQFTGAVAKDRMPAYVNACDAGLAVLQNNPTFKTVYPNKVFDYMACAKPIVVAIDGVARALVCDQARSGLFATPEDPREIADAVLSLCDDPEHAAAFGRAGYAWVSQNMDRRVLATRYLAVLMDLLRTKAAAPGMYRRWGKRAIDVAGSGVALLILAPLLALTAVIVRIALGSPVLFRQLRPGLHERPFTILKFRTMKDTRGEDGALRPDEERLGRFGQWLRSTSLDELPELWNVFRGDMSLVGPRPLLMQYLPRYSAEQHRRHDVRPGITGLAQLNGRNDVPWERKFELDIEYVNTCSFHVDMRLLAETFVAVLRREGISRTGHATAPEFMGSAERH